MAISKKSQEEFIRCSAAERDFVKKELLLKEKRLQNSKTVKVGHLRDKQGFKLKKVEIIQKDTGKADPEYEVVLDKSLRRVKPYFFHYKTFCKERWRDRKLIDIFLKEFRDRDADYYRKTINMGNILVNNLPSTLNTVVKNGDLIVHKVHRHEPAVPSKPIKTVFENDKILVIDKTGGVPAHPNGRFRFNTVTKILERQKGYAVHPCNRLDKATSGLMFLAKTPNGADEFADELKSRSVSKEYVARVVGEFPLGDIVVDKPLKSIAPKVSLNGVCELTDIGAKYARTIFKRISYDGNTSIVQCKPLTGRTHQLRVHLQYLGFPIANDPLYSNPKVWGQNLGKNGEANFTTVISRLDEIGIKCATESWYFPISNADPPRKEICDVCGTELPTDPNINELELWLHAYRYESNELDKLTGLKKWSYQTDLPEWAFGEHPKHMDTALQEARNREAEDANSSHGAI
ncbi:hypothetical protein KAFR_0C01090 [Kazachstania africana CBS 2517]|uniref:Pseudouridine synthase n=1 Tax=Kazachstania africana (strain ATCC 22294 / BCRC 22015 / CBS 2517 / CECT 1963 / NBRC 1671 / NRRL Y-8276) TaxID=1071382 RepID=H2ARV4_KAZAF|nr:hypothetical protein KAFR_0C01090 [Kazachstania africana CBS 2517]CCF57104.1 hypothetical protein KAFR_0C01090 [Kazachstania africana CBS 2517]